MDSVFIKVEKKPDFVSDKELVITNLNFLDEVKKCKTPKPATDILGINYIRNVAEEIAKKYDNTFNAYRNIVPSEHVGVRCETEEQLAVVIQKMFLSTYPQILDKYVEHQLRKRPISTRVVYAVGHFNNYDVFLKLGISEISEKELDAYIGDARAEAVETIVENVELKETELEKEDKSNTFSNFFKLKK